MHNPIMAPDDGWLRTHDEARDLLTYAVPGARVTFSRVARPGTQQGNAQARRFQITVRRVGREPLETFDLYTLPCLAEPLARRARELADHALRA